ncbi:MAG: hypothetical protein KGH64_06490 [Candidatus Micrarchaeota archaeon]|nr:hypothetical protein [Candidatus Micrarchaeota archaeon]MDE1834953.1 hypothetical protein [Candidatus Micrarchaeota archaeon]MDE1859622.1 hypothetical protein [Candidatus Micrarchaeota archaeon]
MFGHQNSGNSYYYGSDTYKHINQMIKRSVQMNIVSPYIDAYYAKIIRKNAPRVEFNIITSSIDKDAKRILTSRGSVPLLLVGLLLSVMLLYVEFTLGVHGYLIGISAVPLVFGFYRYRSKNSSVRRIHLKVPKQFVHAKMYVSNDQAILGSVNLTYKGTHRNVEHIDIIRNGDEVYKIREQFWDMWRRYS